VPTKPTEVTLTLPSRIELLDLVQDLAVGIARLHGFGEEGQTDIGLAMREGAINAMKHGHRFDPRLMVEIRIRVTPASVTISVRDRGPGFEVEEVPDPTLPENILKPSGRGLFLIRTLVDEVALRRLAPGMELVMVKRRPPGPIEASEATA